MSENKDKALLTQINEWLKNKFQVATGKEKILYGILLAIVAALLAVAFSSCSVFEAIDIDHEYDRETGELEIVIKPKPVTPGK